VTAEAAQNGDEFALDNDTEPRLRIADVSPTSAWRHADTAISKLKSIIKDDIKHQRGAFCVVSCNTVVSGGARTTTKLGSSVWDTFSRVLDVERNILVDFASCNNCSEVYSCNSRNGTTTLSKHSANVVRFAC
jgi:hypothetical protein